MPPISELSISQGNSHWPSAADPGLDHSQSRDESWFGMAWINGVKDCRESIQDIYGCCECFLCFFLRLLERVLVWYAFAQYPRSVVANVISAVAASFECVFFLTTSGAIVTLI